MKNLDNSSLFKDFSRCMSKNQSLNTKFREICILIWDRPKLNFDITQFVIKSKLKQQRVVTNLTIMKKNWHC